MRSEFAGCQQARWVPRAAHVGLVVGGLLLVLSGCKQPNEPNAGAKPGGTPGQINETPRLDKRVSLTLIGFNYTDLYIDSFSVNGQGGGNLYVSSPTSGGGGSVCCVGFSPSSKLPLQVKVRWTRDRRRWCEKEVLITDPVPASPEYLAVHFFPDGRIEGEITEEYPEVKLKLRSVDDGKRKASGNNVADEQTARCQDGY
ncbi:DUF3304 domain-containing protein [Archangium lipolyticum]|uniref:DUF3304 domain-containing protein n=1 Tax=Archangium lipolyticum TaxID=2970465 RepID=UPI00214A7BD3|nr:DUF3304 domain-containing protein [Archangium lipolyticum]